MPPGFLLLAFVGSSFIRMVDKYTFAGFLKPANDFALP